MKTNTLVILLIVIFTSSILYDRYVKKRQKSQANDDNDMIEKHFFKKNNNIIIDKYDHRPILWIYVNFKKNSKNWLSFYSRNSYCLNTPYKSLTIQSIINNSNENYNICLIDDNSFKTLLTADEFDKDLQYISEPVKSNYVKLAMLKLLYKYGGFIVPNSFIGFSNFNKLFYDNIEHKGCFIGEFQNTDTLLNTDYVLSDKLIGCKKNNDAIQNIISYYLNILQNDYTSNTNLNGVMENYYLQLANEGKMNVIPKEKMGIVDYKNSKILVSDLLSMNNIILHKNIYGLYIPSNILEKKLNYGWFTRMSEKQVLNSETNIGKLLLINHDM